MKNTSPIILFSFMSACSLSLYAQTYTVDLQADSKNCKLDVAVVLSDRKRNVALTSQKNGVATQGTIRFPEHFVMRLNGKLVEPPTGFLYWYLDASRMIPINDDNRCAFKIQRGDASTSNTVEVNLANGRIRSVTANDIKGRVVATTKYSYPSPIILE